MMKHWLIYHESWRLFRLRQNHDISRVLERVALFVAEVRIISGKIRSNTTRRGTILLTSLVDKDAYTSSFCYVDY